MERESDVSMSDEVREKLAEEYVQRHGRSGGSSVATKEAVKFGYDARQAEIDELKRGRDWLKEARNNLAQEREEFSRENMRLKERAEKLLEAIRHIRDHTKEQGAYCTAHAAISGYEKE